jgi:superfamily I DNA and RNA helicase
MFRKLEIKNSSKRLIGGITLLHIISSEYLSFVLVIGCHLTQSRHFLKLPSEDQATINSFIAIGKNSVVDAIAGSGKTTGILNLGLKCPNAKILVLTYNSKLRLETRERVRHAGLTNAIEVHSYHSFGYNYYSPICTDDNGLEKILADVDGVKYVARPIPAFDIIVLDEAQDLTKQLFTLFLKLAKEVINNSRDGKTPQIVMFGDHR